MQKNNAFYYDYEWHLYPRSLQFDGRSQITIENDPRISLQYELTIMGTFIKLTT
jgi:hypothetical protein